MLSACGRRHGWRTQGPRRVMGEYGLLKLLEPLMTVVLGGIVGLIVTALFLPLIKLLEGLSK